MSMNVLMVTMHVTKNVLILLDHTTVTVILDIILLAIKDTV